MTVHRIITASIALLIAGSVSAETLLIEPSLVDSSEPVEQALRENKGRAVTAIEGQGQALIIGYRASEPIDIFMVPLKSDETFVPMDFMHFTLPKSDDGSVRIDLTVSPGWTPLRTKYLLNVLTKTEDVSAGFTSVEFEPSDILQVLGAGIRHLFTVEPYTPSSYHALRGYRIFSASFTTLMGILLTVICVGCFAFVKAEKKLSYITAVLTLFCFMYGVRFSLDLLRFTHEHLQGYADGLYDEAGSAHQIGRTITDIARREKNPVRVYVCRDGTNYKEKIVKYIAYPTPVTTVATGATLALIMDKGEWGVETTIDRQRSLTTLHCGILHRQAEKLTDFPDGSVLFSLQ